MSAMSVPGWTLGPENGVQPGPPPTAEGTEEYIFRCVTCHRRLDDLVPPVGLAECKCGNCNTVNWVRIMPGDGLPVDESMWVVQRGFVPKK